MRTSFLRRSLRGFESYVPGQQPADAEDWVKLNTNEAPWAPSARVLDAIRAAVDGNLRLYPDPMARAAREAIAQHHQVAPEQVAVGNGADELIEMAFRAFAGAGDRVAFPTPTYPLLEPLALMHECEVVRHPLGEGFALPDSFAQDPSQLKFLVNPNSPTSTWSEREAVLRVATESRGVVVLDEAYVDFAPQDRFDLVREGHANVLLTRTFSKSYALAGMRLGYAVGHPELIAALDMVKDSYSVDRLAIAAAAAAIRDREHHDALVRFVIEERDWLAARLDEHMFHVEHSASNFLFVRPPPACEAARVYSGLRERKILVRNYTQDAIAGWLRVTIGTRHQHEKLLDALEEVLD
jgi:histidinol-phosphate aminotransferase